jgi:hypothetical protein
MTFSYLLGTDSLCPLENEVSKTGVTIPAMPISSNSDRVEVCVGTEPSCVEGIGFPAGSACQA